MGLLKSLHLGMIWVTPYFRKPPAKCDLLELQQLPFCRPKPKPPQRHTFFNSEANKLVKKGSHQETGLKIAGHWTMSHFPVTMVLIPELDEVHFEVNFRVERGIKGPKAVEVEVVEPGTIWCRVGRVG